MNVVIVVGNPKRESRTRAAAESLAVQLTGRPATSAIELADLGPGLLGWNDGGVENAKEETRAADLLIVASPTFKATYSGLLKLFLDQFAAGELAGVTAVPLMLGAAPEHALAPELTLRPVLVEIGCSCPMPGLFLLDSDFESTVALDVWLRRARPFIPAARESA